MGGVRKTQHAVQHAHEQRKRYSQILWASAESEQTLRDALAGLAELPELALPVFLSRYVLHLAACLSPDPIPRRLFDYILANASADYTHEFIELGFLRRALAAPNAIDVSLGELARYSLVALSEHSLRVHPLLQAVVRDSARLRLWNYYYRIWRLLYGISDKKAWKVALWPKRAAHLSSDGVMPDRHSDVTVVQMRPYVTHIETVLSHLPEELFRNFTFRPRLVGMLNSTLSLRRWV